MKFKSIFLILILAIIGITSAFSDTREKVAVISPYAAKVIRVDVSNGDLVYSSDPIATLKRNNGTKVVIRAGISGKIEGFNIKAYQMCSPHQILGYIIPSDIVMDEPVASTISSLPSLSELTGLLFETTGLYALIDGQQIGRASCRERV